MKIYLSLLFVVLITTLISCKKNGSDPNDKNASVIVLKSSAAEYSDAIICNSPGISDPFELGDIVIKGDKVEVTVSYPGGCMPHTFKIIWDEAVTNTNPPGINIAVIHDSHDDSCEAYITEVLTFDLDDLIDSAIVGSIAVDAYNGFNPDDSVVYEGDAIDFSFEQSDTCKLNVTASEVICGWGLFDDIWFALDDSVSAGVDNFYYKMYLQPVSVVESLADFRPVPGKKYTIGAKIDNETDNFPDQSVCLAYPGLSVTVKIMCIAETK